MENAVEALKIVFGIVMFVLALTLSISCFSQANTAVQAIATIRDRETEYTYVKPSDSNRIVGVETIVPTMYKAYRENFRIIFLDRDGVTPLPLYYETDSFGNRTTPAKEINYIDLEKELFPSASEAINHLNIILGKRQSGSKYYQQFIHTDGLYKYLSNNKFKELLGEYYQEDEKAGYETQDKLEINKTKKRVITYVLQ